MGGICCCVYKGGQAQSGKLVQKQTVAPTPLSIYHDKLDWIDQEKIDWIEQDGEGYGARGITSWDVSRGAEPSHYVSRDGSDRGHFPPQLCQAWAVDAAKWRFLLRTSQSLVAACLYGASTFLRWLARPLAMQFVLAVCLAPLVALVYHKLSMNRAGSYYSTFLQMFTQLPRLFLNWGRRDSEAYRIELERERRDGIVRTVNGLETALLFVLVSFLAMVTAVCLSSGLETALLSVLVSFLTMVAAAGLSARGLASDARWRVLETALFFLIHRAWGANLLGGRYAGLLQPESMWRFECDPPIAECLIRPLPSHPQPTY